jgi:hypothetical protein
VWGCAAALAYLSRYIAAGFTYSCTGCDSCRPQAETYVSSPGHGWVKINEPCPVAYRNEAANSQRWNGNVGYQVILESDGKYHPYWPNLDPYGYSC